MVLVYKAWKAGAAPPPPPPGKGILKVDTTPVKGEVFLDSVSLGTAPVSVELAPGSYVVSFGEIAGYITPPDVPVTMLEGQVVTITATYEEIPPPGVAYGWLKVVDANTLAPLRGATVSFDGYSQVTNEGGAVPLTDTTPGTYLVTVSRVGYKTRTTQITLKEGYNNETIRLYPETEPPPDYGLLYGYVTDPVGKPIEFCKVYLDGVHKSTTASSGLFRIELKQSWSGQVTFRRLNYHVYNTVASVGFLQSVRLDVSLSYGRINIKGAVFGTPYEDKGWMLVPLTVSLENPGTEIDEISVYAGTYHPGFNIFFACVPFGNTYSPSSLYSGNLGSGSWQINGKLGASLGDPDFPVRSGWYDAYIATVNDIDRLDIPNAFFVP